MTNDKSIVTRFLLWLAAFCLLMNQPLPQAIWTVQATEPDNTEINEPSDPQSEDSNNTDPPSEEPKTDGTLAESKDIKHEEIPEFHYSVSAAGSIPIKDILSSLSLASSFDHAELSETAGLSINSEDWILLVKASDWTSATLAIYSGESSFHVTLVNEIPADESSEPESKPENVITDCPAFDQSQSIEQVTIRLTADEGVFPSDAKLSVTRLKQNPAAQAVSQEREDNVTVAASYTYDIKVLDAEGNELQPIDDHSVQVSFTLAEAADDNLMTAVYHVTEENDELKAEELDIEKENSTVIVETDSFSYYVVEFFYDTMDYVIPGGTTLALSGILDAFNLSGTVSAVTSSNPALFSASQTDGEWLITSSQPFTTTESLYVVINGITYTITVTDSPDYSAMQGIHQGGTLDDFDQELPITTITRDREKIRNNEFEFRSTNPAVTLNLDPNSYNYMYATYKGPALQNGKTTIDGNYTFTFKDAAYLRDGTTADLIITYSNLTFFLPTEDHLGNSLSGNVDIVAPFACGQSFRNRAEATSGYPSTLKGNERDRSGKQYRYRIGQQVDVKIEIKKDGVGVDDTFLVPVVDIDVLRNNSNFARIFDAVSNNNYSEELEILSGALCNAYIPSSSTYLTNIARLEDGNFCNGIRFSGNLEDKYETFNSGFVTMANGKQGITMRLWNGGYKDAEINSKILSGVGQHVLLSSTTEGGTIQTTHQGNHSGMLDDNSGIIGPGRIGVPKGKTVVYTMTPETGYLLDSVMVGPLEGEFSKVTPETVVKDDESEYYLFEFPNINADQKIHVSWKKMEIEVSKKVSGNMGNKGKDFDFTLTLKDSNGSPVENLPNQEGITDWENKENGIYSFKLKHGETAHIKGMLNGYKYTIAETETAGYTAMHSVGSHTHYLAGASTGEQTFHTHAIVEFLNDWEIAPDVGIKDHGTATIPGLGFAGLLVITLLIQKKKEDA